MDALFGGMDAIIYWGIHLRGGMPNEVQECEKYISGRYS